MELKINQAWLTSNLEADEGHNFTAGAFFETLPHTLSETSVNPMKEAFGTLVLLWRLERNLTVTKLAEVADVDSEEIESIELDEAYRPEPRTVCALATVMKVPELKLLQLSGNAVTADSNLAEQSYAFAANAKRWQQISKEQKKLLRSYMKYLAEQ